MQQFTEGDRVRVDIPDQMDVDHEPYHGEHGRIIAVFTDDADTVTGDTQDARLYRVRFESGEVTDFRRHDLRPPIDRSSNE
jgi:hypothetical protein